jgi:protein-S-isoprenylcysteine O-methyltransferase Ste14
MCFSGQPPGEPPILVKPRLPDPSIFNLLIVVSVIMHFVVPIRLLVPLPLRYTGLVLILSGILINYRAAAVLRKMGTSTSFGDPPTHLANEDVFRISRNPIYLGAIAVLLGLAVLLGSLVTFFFPLLLFALLDQLYIPSEEHEMEEQFGADYRAYTRTVRRWL